MIFVMAFFSRPPSLESRTERGFPHSHSDGCCCWLINVRNKNYIKTKTSTLGVLDFPQLWIHSRYDARKRLDEGTGMAGISGLPVRNQ